MKSDIHPAWHDDCKVICDCGADFLVGATVKSIRVEICSTCHPFFTKKQKFVDTAGRIDRFKERYGSDSLSDMGDRGKKARKAAMKRDEARS
ncbi:50S ribosomal protein L31 [bacterium]|nr:50S ribosomal protein L31 [bacterium]